ncbi:hypothetical protein JM93_04281 [Roseibium hamelinense]|uniref:Uncharacterized protein n=1 Tax=Roseibium hamelinense TaxID=150831 RepID=A0A562SF80_9HYPH|nr:hypothetical protein [Roseibium hamelinense]MTI42900.1 hypothetical protein [Roseibium hamelinense]TWI79932.1 hypothetical protein JM93_04281 [Roseibium hamelinense]
MCQGRCSLSRELKSAVSSLNSLTIVGLAVLAIASGIYTYIGVRGLLNGSNFLVSSAAIAYSVAVSIGIYMFWSYMLRILPLLTTTRAKFQMCIAMGIGCVAIVAISSWLNAAALAGSAAVEQNLAETVEDYQESLKSAYENALAVQGILPDLERAADNFEQIAARELNLGALTGRAGSGTVAQLLSQTAQNLRILEEQVINSRSDVELLYEEGTRDLTIMRELVSSPGEVDARAVEFAQAASSVSGIVAQLNQNSLAPAVKRAAENLNRGFVIPVATGQSAAMRDLQRQAVTSIKQSLAEQSEILVKAADTVLAQEAVQTPRYVPLSPAEAVLKYWSSFIPSWAGAISIDLLPLVIVLCHTIVYSAIRRHEDPLPIEETITLQDMETTLGAIARIQKQANASTATPDGRRMAAVEKTIATARQSSSVSDIKDPLEALTVAPPEKPAAPFMAPLRYIVPRKKKNTGPTRKH